ncbi:MAG: hypothetical protein DRP85_09070 [Candidatus Makaraimicrobium thalassicum]|nr:MAG: hypothetical protein DRP85_09070 [Candidatus Omnitrophota bacterium]
MARIYVVSGSKKPHGPNCGCLVCPNCGASEVDDCRKPVDEWKFQIKAFKVDDWSHCLVCGCWFDLEGNIEK